MNQTAQEGQDAIFQCTMKTLDGDFTSGVLIQYVPVNGTADPWRCVLFQCECRGTCRSGISIQSQRDPSKLLIEYRVEITIPSVVPADSGAVVSCLLLNNNVIQWRGDATLTVDTLLTASTTPPPSDSDDQGTGEGSDPMLQYIAVAPVTVLILIGGVIIVATILYKRRVAMSKSKHQLGNLLVI